MKSHSSPKKPIHIFAKFRCFLPCAVLLVGIADARVAAAEETDPGYYGRKLQLCMRPGVSEETCKTRVAELRAKTESARLANAQATKNQSKDPSAINPKSLDQTTAQTTNQAQVAEGADNTRQVVDASTRDIDDLGESAEDSVNKAEQIVEKKAEMPGQSPSQIADIKHDKGILTETKKLVKQNRIVPEKLVTKVKDPELRETLTDVAVTQYVKKDLEFKRTEAQASLAQLLKMAATAAQGATAMNSLNQDTAGAGTTTAANGASPEAIRDGVSNEREPSRAPASVQEKASIAAKAAKAAKKNLDGSVSDLTSEETAALAKDEKIKSQIGQAVDAATERKSAKSIRAALRKKMREEAAAKAAASKGKSDPDDTESLFGGDLKSFVTADADASEDSDRSPASTGGLPDLSSFDPIKNGEALAGSETDAEVGRLVAEVDQAADEAAGILGLDSKSLFERVKYIHDKCARRKCVSAKN